MNYMMPLSHIRNENGFTLVELIVTLALSSVVILTVVTGALFVERFVKNWSTRDRLDEEAVFICSEFDIRLKKATGVRQSESGAITIIESNGLEWHYQLSQDRLTRNNNPLTNNELRISRLTLMPYTLSMASDSTILPEGVRGLYRLRVVLHNQTDDSCAVNVVLRCPYEYYKYKL